MDYTWTCACCGQSFDTLQMNYAFAAPANWFAIPEEERAARVKLSEDVCIIDKSEIYLLGCLEIPVIDRIENLIFGVWGWVSES